MLNEMSNVNAVDLNLKRCLNRNTDGANKNATNVTLLKIPKLITTPNKAIRPLEVDGFFSLY